MKLIVPVILSGGSGTRLWPISTASVPKQFHALVGSSSLFRQTLGRVGDRTCFAAPVIVCGPGHVEHVRADLAATQITDATIIVEPAARNTAPAIALAALAIDKGDAPMLVMPSDHIITNLAAFLAAIDRALPAVEAGYLATFGIAPESPHTGYGYIASADETYLGSGVHHVARFVEKPDLANAEAMLSAGEHYWNAGIFLMRADAFLESLVSHAPAMAEAAIAAMRLAERDTDALHPDAHAFDTSPSNSIDYAVMEPATNVVVVPVDPGWSDVGSWSALHDLAAKDQNGNAITGDAIALAATGNLLYAAPGMRISTLGIDDLIVIATGSDILVIPRHRAQEIKAIVERRNEKG